MKRVILSLLIALLAFSGWSLGKAPDFNYPQQVTKQAESDLKTALKNGNGQQVVDAIVRVSIAQSQLSRDKMAGIIDRIERTATSETQPDTRALLRHFEAVVMCSYLKAFPPIEEGSENYFYDPNPKATAADTYATWSQTQLQQRIDELVLLSLTDSATLCACPVTKYSSIINYDKLGATYVPTLYQFLISQSLDMVSSTVGDDLLHKWVASTASDATAHTWAQRSFIVKREYGSDRHKALQALLDEQPGIEANGIVLELMNDDNDYGRLREYVARYPKSLYAPAVRNNIAHIERTSASLTVPGQLSSRQQVTVRAKVRNVKQLNVDVYRLTEEMCSADYKERQLPLDDMQRVHTQRVEVPRTVPFDTTIVVTLPALTYGRYVVVPRYDNAKGKSTTPQKVLRDKILSVYDMASFAVCTRNDASRIVVVDMQSGAPVGGATVGDDKWSATSTNDGTVKVPENRGNSAFDYTVAKGADHYGPTTRFQRLGYGPAPESRAELFTDLAIYRPGETMHFAAIAFTSRVMSRQPIGDQNVVVTLSDANGRKVDSRQLTTDKYGRVEGEFTIPTDRLLGTYTLTMHGDSLNYNVSHYVEVSEYKTPTFVVAMAHTDMAYEPGQPITITGTARTYTDLPVANAEVKLSLTQREWEWMWWYRPMRGSYGNTHCLDTVARTDADGRFTVVVDADKFYENRTNTYCRYIYTTQVQVTNAAGESQQTQGIFHIGARREISIDRNFTDVAATNAVRIPVTVNTSDSTLMPTHLVWALRRNRTDTVASGTMPVIDPTIDFSGIPSGQYELKIEIPEAESYNERCSANIALYRKGDDAAPESNVPLWVANDGYYIDNNNVAHIIVGSSVPKAHIYYVATGREHVIKQGWLTLESGIKEITFTVPNEPNEMLNVHFASVYNAHHFGKQVSMVSPVNTQPLQVRASAFRDRLVPGTPEKWQLQLLVGDKPKQGAMMLEMIDRAIHDLQNNTWLFAPPLLSCTSVEMRTMRFSSAQRLDVEWCADDVKDPTSGLQLPSLIDYNTALWLGCGIVRVYMQPMGETGMMMMKGITDFNRAVAEESDGYAADVANAADVAEPTVDRARLDQVEMRMADVKTALWMPMLESDQQGNINITFDAPQFNTTWLLQALAYTSDLNTAMWTRDVLTRKPIMVKPSLPRFVRQGDVVSLAATVQNATDATQPCDALVELFDPRTSQVYAERAYRLDLSAQATQAITIDWTVPDTIAYVGFRVRAAGADFSDGEQLMLPVLTAVSPIVEAQPFFIDSNNGTSKINMRLGHTPQPARYTLEYCDNPVWYAVAALPSVAGTDSHVATSIAHSLFAVDVAQGVTHAQPIIGEALRYWAENCEDSVLVSALSRNSDLKIGTLQASPWLNAAERQTLQMRQLAGYVDDNTARAEHDRLVKALANLQMPDGGFTWYRYDGCKSSLWTTSEVLELIGEIREMGYLPNDDTLQQMLNRATAYLDNAYVEASKRKENKKVVFSSYAYVRSLYPDVPMSKAAEKLRKKTLKAMGKDWRKLNLSLAAKAFYAITLERAAMHKQALDIVASIREFALSDDSRGMYWDSYRSGGWFTPSQVAVTSAVLRALYAVDAQRSELDQVRKWMLLSKQTTDWGGSSLAADAIHALLTTGSEWLSRPNQPNITVDGNAVTLDRFDAYTGYVRRTIDAHSGSEVTIERNSTSPAWGAIYWQYSQPMTQVSPAATSDVSINKDFAIVLPSGTPQQGEIHVGDKVQVRLVVTCTRDIDYLTIVDERAACFEPVDRTSGYAYENHVGQYRETRDAATNIFIASLSKGTHLITYEVFATAPGRFSSGVATLQCQQAPEVTAHSEGNTLIIYPAEENR